MLGAKPAYWADHVSELENSAGNPLYKYAELVWTRPKRWHRSDQLPTFNTDEPFLYALIRNHGKFADKDRIEYIGLTTNPVSRFENHPTARQIVNQHGQVSFSYAPIRITKGRNRVERIKRALEEIEHLLIWAIPDDLWNNKKVVTLPGMGLHGGNAWHICNKGYRFSGRMPREIVYPWMLIVPGRNRTVKAD